MINWQNIARAIDFYKQKGYHYLEVPWIVSSEAIGVTLPKGREAVSTRYGDLVGSAEQSFIQEIIIDGNCPGGKFMAATPCFRDDALDELHQRAFFKVELIEIRPHAGDWVQDSFHQMLGDARLFFEGLVLKPGLIGLEATPEETDITYQGVELGSYGIRQHDIYTWVYGTGYADPRFMIATGRA